MALQIIIEDVSEPDAAGLVQVVFVATDGVSQKVRAVYASRSPGLLELQRQAATALSDITQRDAFLAAVHKGDVIDTKGPDPVDPTPLQLFRAAEGKWLIAKRRLDSGLFVSTDVSKDVETLRAAAEALFDPAFLTGL